MYGHDILNNLRNWAIGWVDWNMALNEQGGPSWILNSADSPIIVNATADEFYKQPLYYFLTHFSRFVPRGSVRIVSQLDGFTNTSLAEDQQLVESVAFATPEGAKVLVVLNRDRERMYQVVVKDPLMPDVVARIQLPPSSVATALWREK